MAATNRPDAARPVRDSPERTQAGSRRRDPSRGVQGALECVFLDEFLSDHGHTFQSIKTLTKARREALLREAAVYATLRLAEIESRAHFVRTSSVEPEGAVPCLTSNRFWYGGFQRRVAARARGRARPRHGVRRDHSPAPRVRNPARDGRLHGHVHACAGRLRRKFRNPGACAAGGAAQREGEDRLPCRRRRPDGMPADEILQYAREHGAIDRSSSRRAAAAGLRDS